LVGGLIGSIATVVVIGIIGVVMQSREERERVELVKQITANAEKTIAGIRDDLAASLRSPAAMSAGLN
jgi:hypothetical protein